MLGITQQYLATNSVQSRLFRRSRFQGKSNCNLIVFVNLWEDFDVKINHVKALNSCFQVQKEIKNYWIRMGMNLNFEFVAQDTFDVRFTNSDLLCEALVHKTFYDVIRNDRAYLRLHMPNYERLKFLGETVLGLIVMEFAYRKYPNAEALIIYEQANNPVKKDRLMEVAERLGIRKCGLVRTQKSVVFENYDDVLEAVVGAIYVDSL
ncbi:unnamed protein product [Orchesella dallaii]|uniref:RNase III domain-containing protein n=1 Tax=Orchesella dallaii TaxID=48710 RepID=A0ABP1S071_9HEXA